MLVFTALITFIKTFSWSDRTRTRGNEQNKGAPEVRTAQWKVGAPLHHISVSSANAGQQVAPYIVPSSPCFFSSMS